MTAIAMAIETMRTRTMQQSNTAFRVAIIKAKEDGAISTNGEAIATLSIDKLSIHFNSTQFLCKHFCSRLDQVVNLGHPSVGFCRTP